MATVTEPRKFNHEETQRSVQHPLQLLRKYIRRYIILEGLAFTLLSASILFWLGLAFDFGMYKFDVALLGVHGIDWILELNDLDATGVTSLGVRVILLTVIVVGLLALGFTKVVLRWLREFNDRALALVLERRYPRELGDRLITAVELADPTLSKKYGYSQAMVEKTILEAVATLKTLPVANVFNWRRLAGLWTMVGLSTVGLLLLNMVLFCVGSNFTQDNALTPYGFSWRFYDVASIWTERNVLMMNTYWPRRAHLEIENFQAGKSDMRVARDDVRPELQVRAYEWVIADRSTPHGWRALKWKDLSERKLIAQEKLDKVTIPADFKEWRIDLDELESGLVTVLFGDDSRARKSGELAEYLRTPSVAKKARERGADEGLARLLDWREWTVDKIKLQEADTDTRVALRAVVQEYGNLEAIFKDLEALAATPSMSRTIRQLDIPASVEVRFRGEESGSTDNPERQVGNKFRVPLEGLPKDSTHFKFRARGDDYYTVPRTITLVAAAAPKSINIDKEEPAYIYHRLLGPDQTPLSGEKHYTKDLGLSITGDTNTIEVPLGTKLSIHMKTDRKLRAERPVFVKDESLLAAGFDPYKGSPPAVHGDHNGFSLEMTDITRKHDFTVEFFDEDNIRGRRRFKILSIIDNEPSLGNLNIFSYLPRKPKFKTPVPTDKEKDKEPRDLRDQLELGNAYLITPDALIPVECSIKDDYGLVRAGYHYKYRKVDFELVASGGAGRLPSLQINEADRRYHAGVVLFNMQFWPGNPISWHAGHNFLALTLDLMQGELRRAQGYKEGYLPSNAFRDLLERREGDMIRLADLKQAAQLKNRNPRSWEFEFNTDPGFDVQKYLQEIKTNNPDKIGQMHYHLQIAVQATDNNVETGEEYRDENGLALRGNTKKNGNGYLSFIVVSENELLAQIALEEDVLKEKLENAKERVDAGITSLLEQQSKTRDEKADMESILNRMNEIRTALATSGTNLREAHQAYENITREMVVNRVRSERVNKIKEAIITRLDHIVLQDPRDPSSGTFIRAEESLQKAQQLVEEEANAKRGPDVQTHAVNMTEANRDMVRLSDDIKALLDAMQEGIVENRLIALLVAVEQRQREQSRILEEIQRRIIDEEIRKLIGDDPKKDEKKSEKKTSLLKGGPMPDSHFAAAIGPERALGYQPNEITASCSEKESQHELLAMPFEGTVQTGNNAPRILLWKDLYGLGGVKSANFNLCFIHRLC